MRAADCTRTFVLLAAGGVRCRWDCGVQRDYPGETAVDVEVLADRYPPEHHHRRRHHHG